MILAALASSWAVLPSIEAATNVYLTGVPDYDWWRGCFGTATGNLIGFWDRHGFPDFYTGPTANGLAPLNSRGTNQGIFSLWASRAGYDGRPATQPGHNDDYYIDYESIEPDPYVTAHRSEHSPDCVGDFIGLNQKKWTNLNDECAGNIDAYAFVYWDATGATRTNYVPPPAEGQPVSDIPSGLRAWTEYRGEAADVVSQLTEFNPTRTSTSGFTFADLKGEIDAGYPVLLFLQNFAAKSRRLGTMTNANPSIHGMLAYGYYIADDGTAFVRYRDSWAGGDNRLCAWGAANWEVDLPVRGVILYHPLPKIKSLSYQSGNVSLGWSGPASQLYNAVDGTVGSVHWYVVEKATAQTGWRYGAVTPPTLEHEMTLTNCWEANAWFRVRLAKPEEIPTP